MHMRGLIIMTVEKRVEFLEDRLVRTLEVLKLFVHLDRGLDRDTTSWLEEQIEELQKWED